MADNIEAVKGLLKQYDKAWHETLCQLPESSITISNEHDKVRLKFARQIDALYPKKEEIEARERDRILGIIEDKRVKGIRVPMYILTYQDMAALKGEPK